MPDARALAKRVIPRNTRWTLRVELEVLRERGLGYVLRWNAALADAWTRDRVARRRYRLLDEEELRAARRSDTVFVFGSGSSLNEITPGEWTEIGRHDTFGFNYFYRQQWVRPDFHLLRGGVYTELRWQPHAHEVRDGIAANPLYRDTIFILPEDYLGHFANIVVGRGILRPGTRIFRYRTLPGPGLPGRSFAEGIRHAPGTLSDAVNSAYCLGWKKIVLAGVDLYDSRYFWLPPDKTLTYDPAQANVVPGERNLLRGNRPEDPHNTTRGGVVEQMREWRAFLAEQGVTLTVYNPRSLLAEVLPVEDRAA